MTKQCTYKDKDGISCNSFAFNLSRDGIKQGKFCDKHYWQDRALKAEALAQPAEQTHSTNYWLHEVEMANIRGYTQGRVSGLKEALVQPEQERNFCSRCGKRLGIAADVHTCTPPRTFDDYGNKIV